MTILFQFKEISIQIIPKLDLCYIWKNGWPIWSGNRIQLIKLLEEI